MNVEVVVNRDLKNKDKFIATCQVIALILCQFLLLEEFYGPFFINHEVVGKGFILLGESINFFNFVLTVVCLIRYGNSFYKWVCLAISFLILIHFIVIVNDTIDTRKDKDYPRSIG